MQNDRNDVDSVSSWFPRKVYLHMQGIIFVTWEKYLTDRFGSNFLNLYRETIGETTATVPLTSRVYLDEFLLAGVGAASQLSHFPADTLLREYGRYFLINGLTSHLCAYLLAQAHSGRELLLMMRQAHAQMRKNPDGLTPPVFRYEILTDSPQGITLIYDSHRQLCSVLYGAIEGAAERFGERAHIVERTCMKNGASECRFEVNFVRISAKLSESARASRTQPHPPATRRHGLVSIARCRWAKFTRTSTVDAAFSSTVKSTSSQLPFGSLELFAIRRPCRQYSQSTG